MAAISSYITQLEMERDNLRAALAAKEAEIKKLYRTIEEMRGNGLGLKAEIKELQQTLQQMLDLFDDRRPPRHPVVERAIALAAGQGGS